MSWNIRTLGVHPAIPDDLERLASTILTALADIVCIQEVQAGKNVSAQVGAPVSPDVVKNVGDLLDVLKKRDPNGQWAQGLSGISCGDADHMRDAYAFLWKGSPKNSDPQFTHPDPVDEISSGNISILRQQPTDNFPGRRPGMWQVNVKNGNATVPANIISYHARNPINKLDGAGEGIRKLATLGEIGGGMRKCQSGRWTYIESVKPLPQIDTLVLGDFNFTMDHEDAPKAYRNLLSNYQACISVPGKVTYTTYGTQSTEAFRAVSAYDNIFVLKGHAGFTPLYVFTGNFGCKDFIQDAAIELGTAIGGKFDALDTWYVIHQDLYKGQYAVRGLSDHMPVWADFAIGAGSPSQAILNTSTADNNGLLHAMFGQQDNTGQYIAADAATRRQRLIEVLDQCLNDQKFTIPEFRTPILLALKEQFFNYNNTQLMLGKFINNPNRDPFDDSVFGDRLDEYIQILKDGRRLFRHEAEILCYIYQTTLELWRLEAGQFKSIKINDDGSRAPVHVFGQIHHFSRFKPS